MFKRFSSLNKPGQTTLANGDKVFKTNELVELYGGLDELNSFIGWSAEVLHCQEYQDAEHIFMFKQLIAIQRQLFCLGQELTDNKLITSEQMTKKLEELIEAISNKLPTINAFVLPGGGEFSSRLHITRSVCRRIELLAFKVYDKKHNKALVIASYLNRLSDLFFVMARFSSFISNVEEITL